MSSPSPAVLDPLAAPQESFLDASVSVATVPRRERIAPDVTAIGGAEAVTLVRAAGFIAAIESVASEFAEGTVIEQDPPAGEQLEREGVITLRLATPPLESAPLATATKAGLASQQAPPTAAPDDTEEWFRALASNRPDKHADAAPGKRRRKHRRPTSPARELIFDPPPPPSVVLGEPPHTATHSRRASERASALVALASSACALAPPLAGLQWRRASALLAGVLLLALLGIRFFASGERRALSMHPRALARISGAHVPARRPAGAVPPRRPSPEPRAGDSRMPNRARRRKAPPVALAAAGPVHQPEASAPAATAAPPSATGQFAYLGQ